MKEQGVVIEIKNDTVIVEITPHEKCTKCCSCGAGRKRTVSAGRHMSAHLDVGDKVEIEVDSSKMLKIYTYLCGIPLVVFVGVILAAYAVCGSPIISFLASLAGTAIAFFVISVFLKGKEEYSPKLRKVIE